ncbi:Hypothetical protein D9617_12g037350 [Elsinoe fawcettii]|nr:Hypothetical protein D9617_12g037350 [Elsinoe fawcettii]
MIQWQTPWEEKEMAASLPSPREKADALATVMDSALSIQDAPTADEVLSDSEGDEPPPYMASPLPSPAPQNTSDAVPKSANLPEVWRMYQKLQYIPWKHYMPPSAQLSSDASTVTIVDVPKDHTAEIVSRIILDQIRLPPQQMVRIQGRHQTWTDANKSLDFDLTLNLTPYFLDDEGSSSEVTVAWQTGCQEGSRTVNNTKGDSIQTEITSGLERCYRNKQLPSRYIPPFPHSSSPDHPSIILHRVPTNFSKSAISTSLLGLMGYIRYKGDIEITFPTTSTRVILNLPPLPSPGSDPPKRKSLFSSLVSSLSGEKSSYTVRAEWPFASHPVQVDELGSTTEDPGRTFTTKSEAAWFADWEAVIRRAAVRKQTTQLGLDAWMQNMTDPLRKAEMPSQAWGVHAYQTC